MQEGCGKRAEDPAELSAKGKRTRARIIAATVELVAEKPLKSITVFEIARKSGISSTTFYFYFADVYDAILAEVEEASDFPEEAMEPLRRRWTAQTAPGLARRFVANSVEIHQRHLHLFRIRNLAAEEGHAQAMALRRRFAKRPMSELIAKLSAKQEHGLLPSKVNPIAMAGSLLAMVERLSITMAPLQSRNARATPTYNISTQDMIESAAFILASHLAE